MGCINQESSVKSDSGESCDQGSPMSASEDGDVCRDYLRNVCKRGRRCKYKHPMERNGLALGLLHEQDCEQAVAAVGARRFDLNFCHDFQNAGCKRPQCKFVHCTREEEEFFRATGQLPLGVRLLSCAEPLMNLGGEAPVCKDFLKGQCKRAAKCKFRHVTNNLPSSMLEIEAVKRNRASQAAVAAAASVTMGLPQPMQLELSSSALIAPNGSMDFFDLAKRRRLDCSTTSYAAEMDSMTLAVDSLRGGVLDVRVLLEENVFLRRKIDELHKQCQDMVATNEVLLDQNARLRNSKIHAVVTASHIVAPTMSPAVMSVHDLPIGLPIMASSIASQNTLVATALPTVSCTAQVCMTPTIVVTGTPRCTTDFVAPSQPNMVTVCGSLPASSITSIISFPAPPLPPPIN